MQSLKLNSFFCLALVFSLTAHSQAVKSVKCLYVSSEAELDPKQRVEFGQRKIEKKAVKLFGLQTSATEQVIVWESKFLPSLLDASIQEMNATFQFPMSTSILSGEGLALSGASEMFFAETLQKKIQSARSLDFIEQEDKKNSLYGFELSPEQKEKITKKFESTKLPSVSANSVLAVYENLDAMAEPLTEILPEYLLKLSDDQMAFYLQYQQGQIDKKYLSNEAELEKMVEAINKAKQLASDEAEVALFNMSDAIEENLPQANGFLYISKAPMLNKLGRYKSEQRLYICEIPKTLELDPQPKMEPKAKPDTKASQPQPDRSAPKNKGRLDFSA